MLVQMLRIKMRYLTSILDLEIANLAYDLWIDVNCHSELGSQIPGVLGRES